MSHEGVCRCCLIEKILMHNIFKEEISEKLKLCGNILIEENDSLPDTICDSCFTELNISYNFRLKCEESDKSLRNFEIIVVKEEAEDEIIYKDDSSEDNKVNETHEEDLNSNCEEINNFVHDKEDFSKIEHIVIIDSNENEQNFKADSQLKENGTKERIVKKRNEKWDNTKSYECEVCNKKFASNGYLIHHNITKHNLNESDTIKCLNFACNEHFKNISSLKLHMRKHEFKTCPHCNKKFPKSNSGGFRIHIARHLAKEYFKCSKCNKQYATEYEYKRHLLTHTENRPKYTCSYCSKVYETLSGYKTHLKIHSGNSEPRFHCEYCGKGWQSNSDLVRHLRFHTGERPYECEICHAKYATNYHLTVHKRNHTGEKPYVCPICNKSFTRSQTKKHHMYSHDVNAKFPCKFCGKIFGSPRKLQRHEKHHIAP